MEIPCADSRHWPYCSFLIAGWSSPVARQAHNLKVAGSNPAPATNLNPARAGLFMSETNVYQVYVIRNAAGKFYIGLSKNVQIRLQQHNQGVSTWTRHRGPWSLVWESESLTLSEARKLENRLKRQQGGAGFYKLTERPSSSGS